MNFLILIACLSIERYLHIGSMLNRFAWMEAYLDKVQDVFPKDSPLIKGFMGVIVAILPIILLVGLLLSLLVYLQLGLSGLGAFFIILIYCFGPDDLYSQAQIYFVSVETNNKENADVAYQELTGEVVEPAEDSTVMGKKLTEAMLVKANSCIFGVVCWYAIFGFILGPIFGALGVLMYRLIFIIAELAEKKKKASRSFEQEIIRLNGWMNWVSARVTSLFYVFTQGLQIFSVWSNRFFSGTDYNKTILIECGLASLQLSKKEGEALMPIDDNKRTISFLDKALVIFVAVAIVINLIFSLF